ncbi:MAG: hypothetical protein GF331_00450 [Chitinivibrionales bacterium]|nr:hypothetical protein [Chitinivibrionales bacterium]
MLCRGLVGSARACICAVRWYARRICGPVCRTRQAWSETVPGRRSLRPARWGAMNPGPAMPIAPSAAIYFGPSSRPGGRAVRAETVRRDTGTGRSLHFTRCRASPEKEQDVKYVAIFHANLNYAFLEDHKYEQVIRASYETILDTFMQKHPDAKFVFEASGYTIQQMADRTPDVLEKLVKAVKSGQCEFMGAPYAHPIMANIPEEDGYWSNYFSMQTYQKCLGFKPESTWNPECTWKQYVPRTFRRAGYRYMTLDFESYMISSDKDYGWVERNRCQDMQWGGNLPWYDLDPNCPYLHRPFRDVVPGLHGMCRSDRLVGKYVSYFLGKITLDEYLETIRTWSGDKDQGATIFIADDAEYTGTTGYYYVKHHRDYSRSFSADPGAAEKLDRLVTAVKKMGEMVTFKEACEMEPVDKPYFVEDGLAWHRAFAHTWGGTPEAKAWDPILSELRKEYHQKYQRILESDDKYRPLVEKFWFHMTNSANSDGRWPPPPMVTCPFNREWVLKEIEATRATLAEIDKAIQGVTPPSEPDESTGEDWDYGLYFTDKNLLDLAKLNDYELGHGLYAAFRMFDAGKGDVKEEGRKRVNAIYEELERRRNPGVAKRRV